MLRVAVLGSTRGSSLQGVIDAIASKELRATIEIIIANKPQAGILQRAKEHGIANKFIDPKGLDREAYDALLVEEIKKHKVDVILLVGFMRIVSPLFIDAFDGNILNVHPSLLPKFAGLMDLAVHQAVIDAGEKWTGCSIHLVTQEVDAGRVVLQLKCEVYSDDIAQTLKERVQVLEKQAFVQVLKQYGSLKQEQKK